MKERSVCWENKKKNPIFFLNNPKEYKLLLNYPIAYFPRYEQLYYGSFQNRTEHFVHFTIPVPRCRLAQPQTWANQ